MPGPFQSIRRAARWLIGPLLAGCSAAPRAPAPPPVTQPKPPATAPAPVAAGTPALAAPRAVHTPTELRRQAAERLVAANPGRSYMSKPPDILLAIPVLEVELHGDGRVKNVKVIRKPRQALDTVQLAIDAVHRAAPFGDVRRMPKPWVFTETFLFDDDRRFKPRTLD